MKVKSAFYGVGGPIAIGNIITELPEPHRALVKTNPETLSAKYSRLPQQLVPVQKRPWTYQNVVDYIPVFRKFCPEAQHVATFYEVKEWPSSHIVQPLRVLSQYCKHQSVSCLHVGQVSLALPWHQAHKHNMGQQDSAVYPWTWTRWAMYCAIGSPFTRSLWGRGVGQSWGSFPGNSKRQHCGKAISRYIKKVEIRGIDRRITYKLYTRPHRLPPYSAEQVLDGKICAGQDFSSSFYCSIDQSFIGLSYFSKTPLYEVIKKVV